jgi:CHRD domain
MRYAWAVLLICGVSLSAQGARTFKARLSPVPIDVTMQATIAGTGAVTATLAGTKLTIAGTFDGLKSAATIAKIHKSPIRGVRGPEVFTLTVTPGTSGSISGTFDLNPQQLTELQNGRLYVQLHSDKAPDGNLWGWLLEKK